MQMLREIEIIGAYLILELSTIVDIILTVTVISIIAISAKSRLHAIPRR